MDEFLKIMDRLLAEDGCPWDRVQTHESLRRYLIEESYEVIDAIDKGSDEGLCEELGDVLLQVVFHAKLAEKEGKFTFEDVVKGVSDKMVYRHPHVFAQGSAKDAEEVLYNWDELKKKEKGYKSDVETLESIPKALPALMRAEKLVSKGNKLRGEKPDFEKITKDLEKCVSTLKMSNIDENDKNMEIVGKILMDVVRISNIFKINTEFALTNELEKFINMFRCF